MINIIIPIDVINACYKLIRGSPVSHGNATLKEKIIIINYSLNKKVRGV